MTIGRMASILPPGRSRRMFTAMRCRADDVECAFRRTANGYRFELGFPVRALLPFRPAVGRALGIGILLNNQNSDAKTPQSRLVWGLRAELYNQLPARWPLVILTDGSSGDTTK